MKVIIVEDEILASENLSYMLKEINPEIKILAVLDSVKSSIKYFENGIDADLIFMDIHLADGISFEIFEQVKIKTPLIFTTAYDQYAIKAFKLNSIDYILKPIDEEELENAVNKYLDLVKVNKPVDNSQLENVLKLLNSNKKSFKATFLVQKRDELIPIKTEDIAYFYIDEGIVKVVSFSNNSLVINKKLEDIENEIDPQLFFRTNRQMIINRNAFTNIKYYFNGKLIVNTLPKYSQKIIVSKIKASELKKWLGA
ncbi:MAG: response regulator transcription factor [Bacteroidetes bacterium]|nr:response regulator transcription factor [Bacteroidota bacterium]